MKPDPTLFDLASTGFTVEQLVASVVRNFRNETIEALNINYDIAAGVLSTIGFVPASRHPEVMRFWAVKAVDTALLDTCLDTSTTKS